MPKKASFLQELAKKEPDYVNTEYVYPCKVKEIVYKNSLCENNSHLFSFVTDHLKTIVTPYGYKALSKKSATELIDVLQSLYENGRVLESKDTITIDEKPYIITMKGVGATNYYRTTEAINPFMNKREYKEDKKKQEKLHIFPFAEQSGWLPLESALIEKGNAEWLESLGIDVEKVLAIHTLSEVIGSDGGYISIQDLEKNNIIHDNKMPCIITRLQKTNIRLLDVFMMQEYKKTELIAPTIEEILRIAKIHRGVNNINEYLSVLINKIFHNRLQLSLYCPKINGQIRHDVARNITVLGEEVDLVTIEKYNYELTSPHYLFRNYASQIEKLAYGIQAFIAAIEKTKLHTIDHQLLANTIRSAVRMYVTSNKKMEIKKMFHQNGRYKWYNNTATKEEAFIKFYNEFIKNIFAFVTESAPSIGYEEILAKDIRGIFGA